MIAESAIEDDVMSGGADLMVDDPAEAYDLQPHHQSIGQASSTIHTL